MMVTSNHKTEKDQPDKLKVDAKNISEVEYLHSQFPTYSHLEITNAITIAGPLRDDVIIYLNNYKK